MFKLNVRTTKKEGIVPLFTRLRIEDKSYWINLHLNVNIKLWNEVSKSSRKLQNFLNEHGYSKKLNEIEIGIHTLKSDKKFTFDSVDELVKDVVLKENREDFIKRERVRKELKDRENKSIKSYVTSYVDKMETGENRNNKGEIYSYQTIKVWKQFRRIFLDFYEKKPFTWEEIDKNLINRFTTYLEKCDYMKKTRNKYLGCFKQILGDSELDGLHTNHISKLLVKKSNVKESDKSKKIYLTKEEIEGFYGLSDLTPTEEKVRDMFLIGCYTGQRFSDFSNIHKDCIGKTSKGVRVIRIEQEKTDSLVVIPIMDDRLELLLKKYDYNVPNDVTDQVFNKTIKRIGKELSKTIPSLSIKEKTLLTKKEKLSESEGKSVFERDCEGNVVKPRYDLISSHTCRRSCITNMYKSGKYSISQIMSVSGHKTERSFNEYVKLSLDERAEEVFKSTTRDGMF